MGRLERKITLVTGAARGIGASIARAFIREGAYVYVTDIAKEEGEALTADLGSRAVYLPLDVREEAQWAHVTKAVMTSHGRLDVLVNNAGITGFETGSRAHDPENASLDDWREVHRTNLDGVFLGCKYAIRSMRPTKTGSIINISSRSGMVGIPGAAAYASSKAAVRNHTKTVALWCAQNGLTIRCNSIHPGAIHTSMWEPVFGTGPDRNKNIATFTKDIPLHRFGKPDEVAAMALFLASDESLFVTGSELSIDGGLLAGSVATPAQADI
jgi:NAD(P)-dependent dehydrogenase (short-subunit alcohol dehydrogenase family)